MTLQAWNDVADPVAGEGVSATDYGIPVLENLDRLHALEDQPIRVQINGATPLVTGDTQDDVIWDPYGGGSIVDVGAVCRVGSTSGDVTLDIQKNGVSILTTKITLEQNETSSLNATAQPEINSALATVAKGDRISFVVDAAGASVTYLIIIYVLRPSA
jgi:hypothetical protein